ncbi:MAG: peroxidase family protein, partial [Verrucomicrobiota bacterium]
LIADSAGVVTQLSLLNAFFRPSWIRANGIDGILRGQAGNSQQEIDRFIVDDVRNFLFGPGFGGLDLAALNIQRGRDHGLPPFHHLRQGYGLAGLNSFNSLSSDSGTILAIQGAYGSVRDVDSWTGGVSERHRVGTSLGETFTAIFVDQFTRLRDGDRFYFENPEIYSTAFTNAILNTTFADIIRRNTGLTSADLNDYSFFLPGPNPLQSDARVGPKRRDTFHRGNDVYNGSGALQKIRERLRGNRSSQVFFSVQNDGVFRSPVTIRASITKASSLKSQFRDLDSGRENVTATFLTGLYSTVQNPNTFRTYLGRFKRDRTARQPRSNWVKLRAESVLDEDARDVVKARIARS